MLLLSTQYHTIVQSDKESMTTSTLFVVLICLFITGNAYAAWKPLPLNLRRVIGSMTAAADHVGGTYVRGISAYGNVGVTFFLNYK